MKKKILTFLWCLGLTSVLFSCDHWQTEIAKLHDEASYVTLDLQMSESDVEVLQSLVVEDRPPYDNFGHLQDLQLELTNVLVTMGNSQDHSQKASNIIATRVLSLLEKLNCQTAWVTVRCCQPHSLFTVPRWHTDGSYFTKDANVTVFKIAWTIKGPSTLFCSPDDGVRCEFDRLVQLNMLTAEEFKKIDQGQRHTREKVLRQHVAQLLRDQKVDACEPSRSAVAFIVGDCRAAIHSEPDITEPRIFLSIVPGTSAQIQELYQRWHM